MTIKVKVLNISKNRIVHKDISLNVGKHDDVPVEVAKLWEKMKLVEILGEAKGVEAQKSPADKPTAQKKGVRSKKAEGNGEENEAGTDEAKVDEQADK